MTQSLIEQSFELLEEIQKLINEMTEEDDEIKAGIIMRKIKMYKDEMDDLLKQFEEDQEEEEKNLIEIENKLKGE